MATAKDCHTLTSYFIRLYKEKYGTEPVVNRHSARWGFDSILMGMHPTEVKALLEFYFTTNNPKRHTLDWFFYNYDKLIESRRAAEEDAERRSKLRKESEERAREWRDRVGNQGIASN